MSELRGPRRLHGGQKSEPGARVKAEAAEGGGASAPALRRATGSDIIKASKSHLTPKTVALQTGLEVAELAPFVRTVRRVIERNKDRVSWPAIFAKWDEAVRVCHAIEDEVRAGKTYIRWRRKAANLIAEIAENVEASRVFELVAAVYLYAEIRPERFASDAGFNAEVLHVVRREAKAGRLFTVGARSTVSYRLLSGRVRDTAARFIIDALGHASLAVAKAETRRMNALAAKATEQRQAIDAIA